MADTKSSNLTSNTVPLVTDKQLYLDDPGGTPDLQNVTNEILFNYMHLPVGLVTSTTASGAITLTDASETMQLINPDGAVRQVNLPAEATTNHAFYIKNTAASSGTNYALTVKDDAAAVIATIRNQESEIFYSNGTNWFRFRINPVIYVEVEIFSPTVDCATGDGKKYFIVPPLLNGMNLVYEAFFVITPGTTGNQDHMIYNVTDSQDMISVARIEDGEYSTLTSGTPGVIDTDHDDVATGDKLRFDFDAVNTTKAKGSYAILGFALP